MESQFSHVVVVRSWWWWLFYHTDFTILGYVCKWILYLLCWMWILFLVKCL